MIVSADIASRLQPTGDATLRATPPTQEITDKLSGLVAGQRLLAEIQSLMPNGTYRALINQRNVTLALPFAAKSGDTIELEVTESKGKLTLAVLSTSAAAGSAVDAESSATNLSHTGQLISKLLTGSRDAEGRPAAVPLNGNQPIANAPPRNGQELLPLLQQAIKLSGMFYESHQAQWVEGNYPQADLQQEPQGKLPARGGPPLETAARSEPSPSVPPGAPGRAHNEGEGLAQTIAPSSTSSSASPTQPAGQALQTVAPQLQPLVQQQLEAFATQNFSWQGQIWPGQQMQWEIEDERARGESGGNDVAGDEKWQTRLRLTLPKLGAVDVRLHIRETQISLVVLAPDAATREVLRGGGAELSQQLSKAGLELATIGIAAPPDSQNSTPVAS